MIRNKELLDSIQRLQNRVESLEKIEFDRVEEKYNTLLQKIKENLGDLSRDADSFSVEYTIKDIKLICAGYYADRAYYLNGKQETQNLAKRLFNYVDTYYHDYLLTKKD